VSIRSTNVLCVLRDPFPDAPEHIDLPRLDGLAKIPSSLSAQKGAARQRRM